MRAVSRLTSWAHRRRTTAQSIPQLRRGVRGHHPLVFSFSPSQLHPLVDAVLPAAHSREGIPFLQNQNHICSKACTPHAGGGPSRFLHRHAPSRLRVSRFMHLPFALYQVLSPLFPSTMQATTEQTSTQFVVHSSHRASPSTVSPSSKLSQCRPGFPPLPASCQVKPSRRREMRSRVLPSRTWSVTRARLAEYPISNLTVPSRLSWIWRMHICPHT